MLVSVTFKFVKRNEFAFLTLLSFFFLCKQIYIKTCDSERRKVGAVYYIWLDELLTSFPSQFFTRASCFILWVLHRHVGNVCSSLLSRSIAVHLAKLQKNVHTKKGIKCTGYIIKNASQHKWSIKYAFFRICEAFLNQWRVKNKKYCTYT